MATFDNITLEIITDSGTRTEYPDQVKIKYRGGAEQTVNKADIASYLQTYLDIEGSSLTPLELVNAVRDEKEKAAQEAKDKKKKKVKRVVTWIAIPVVATLGLQGGYILVKKLFGLDKGKDNELPKEPQTRQVEVVNTPISTEEPIITPEPTVEPTSEPTPEPVVTPGPISDVEIPHEEKLPFVNGASSDWINMNDEQYLEALNAQSVACQMNMPEVSFFLEGNELIGEKHVSSIQNSFYDQSPEYCIVEYFNQMRNDVVNAAYDTRSRDNTIIMLDIHIRELYGFINGEYGVTLNTNQGEITFFWNNLSDEARNAILDVYFGLAIGLPHDYQIQIGDRIMTAEDFGNHYESELTKVTLINPTHRR